MIESDKLWNNQKNPNLNEGVMMWSLSWVCLCLDFGVNSLAKVKPVLYLWKSTLELEILALGSFSSAISGLNYVVCVHL